MSIDREICFYYSTIASWLQTNLVIHSSPFLNQ